MLRFSFETSKKIQAAAVVLRCENDRMSYLRLLKLLYIADREAIQETGKPIVGSRAVAMDRGPLHSELLDLIKGQHRDEPEWSKYFHKQGYQIELREDPGRLDLSPCEIGKLTDVTERYANLDDWELVDITHEFGEFQRNFREGTSTTIPLEHILEACGQSAHVDHVVGEALAQKRLATLLGE